MGTRNLDPRLQALGVTLTEANVPVGAQYWRIVEVIWQDEQQAGSRHTIDVDQLNEQGARILGATSEVRWATSAATLTQEPKPAPEYGANFPMYAAGCSYSLKGLGLPSDTLNCLGLGDIARRDWTIHVVYRVKFKRTTKTGTPPPPPPPPATELQWAKIAWAMEQTARVLKGEGYTREHDHILASQYYRDVIRERDS
jgi:hypothetical protein